MCVPPTVGIRAVVEWCRLLFDGDDDRVRPLVCRVTVVDHFVKPTVVGNLTTPVVRSLRSCGGPVV